MYPLALMFFGEVNSTSSTSPFADALIWLAHAVGCLFVIDDVAFFFAMSCVMPLKAQFDVGISLSELYFNIAVRHKVNRDIRRALWKRCIQHHLLFAPSPSAIDVAHPFDFHGSG